MSESNKDFNRGVRLLKDIGISGGLGIGLGTIAALGATAFTDPESATRIGLKTAASVAGLSYFLTEHNRTLNSTPSLEDRPLLHRLKQIKAVIESGIAYGIPGAFLSASYDTPGWVIGMGTLGIVGGLTHFHERFRGRPELIFPEGSSITEAAGISDDYLSTRLPKVYRSDSIADILKFRAANQEQIVRWVSIMPDKGDPVQYDISPSNMVNAVFLTTVRHVPVYDPEIGREMTLHDRFTVAGGDSIVVSSTDQSQFFWPYHPTNLEDSIGLSHPFNPEKWNGFREVSWEREVAILAQYQTTKPLSDPSPENIVDRFWLIDIHGDGMRSRSKEDAPQRSSVLIPMPNPGRI